MAELLSATLGAGIKSFGGRVFELTRSHCGEVARIARRSAADASRAYARALPLGDGHRARRPLELAFKALSDTVRALDEISREPGETAVLAASLAAEAVALCEEVYDLVRE